MRGLRHGIQGCGSLNICSAAYPTKQSRHQSVFPLFTSAIILTLSPAMDFLRLGKCRLRSLCKSTLASHCERSEAI